MTYAFSQPALSLSLLRRCGLLSADEHLVPLLYGTTRPVRWWSEEAIASAELPWDPWAAGAVPFADSGDGEAYMLVGRPDADGPAVASVDMEAGIAAGAVYLAPSLEGFIFRCLLETLNCARVGRDEHGNPNVRWLVEEIDLVSALLPKHMAGALRQVAARVPRFGTGMMPTDAVASFLTGNELQLTLVAHLGPRHLDTSLELPTRVS